MSPADNFTVNLTLVIVAGFLIFSALIGSCCKQRAELDADLRKNATTIQTCVNHSAADRIQVVQAF